MATESCLIHCGREATVRGLCSRCYQSAKACIRSGENTEQELIKRKLILPKHVKPRTAFAKALAES